MLLKEESEETESKMDGADIFFITFALLMVMFFAFFCLKGSAQTKIWEALSILTDCLKSLCHCSWTSRQVRVCVRDTRETNIISIATIGEINRGFYEVNYAPPSYESVVAADKTRDQGLPSYEDALKIICIYDVSNVRNKPDSTDA